MHQLGDSPPLPSGVILISQPEQLGATPKEMVDALPRSYRGVPQRSVDLDMAETARQAIRSRDWGAARRELEERFRRDILPLREKHPDYRVVYFGSAPIPLAVELGFLLETWWPIEVVPHHHARRSWGWIDDPGGPPARLTPVPLPDFKDRTEGEAVIRVSTSHLIDPQMTRRVVPQPLLEIDIALEHPSEDAFSNSEQMEVVAAKFRETLDVVGDRFEGIQRVHLFASVQPGMALLLGAQISKTMHPAVQTYQYARNEEDEPFHVPALLVNAPSRPTPLPPTPEEQARAKADREQMAKDLDRMKGLANQQQATGVKGWLAGLLPKPEEQGEFSGAWRHLPLLHETPLLATEVDVATQHIEDAFHLAGSNRWEIGDQWLARLARRLPDEAERHRALRLLILHELAHRGPQMLTSTSSEAIGRFPKVLEAVDYEADVWGMLHEHVLTALQGPREIEKPARFFEELLVIATETMWAFDDHGQDLREIEVRRLNRYLAWYWQCLRLERAAAKGHKAALATVLSILAERPIIELAGPHVHTRGERVYFALDGGIAHVAELAVYYGGRLYRHGTRLDFPISALIEGVRERDGKKIRAVLRGAAEQTVR